MLLLILQLRNHMSDYEAWVLQINQGTRLRVCQINPPPPHFSINREGEIKLGQQKIRIKSERGEFNLSDWNPIKSGAVRLWHDGAKWQSARQFQWHKRILNRAFNVRAGHLEPVSHGGDPIIDQDMWSWEQSAGPNCLQRLQLIRSLFRVPKRFSFVLRNRCV